MKNYELNDNELDQIIGGVLTPEAESWVSRNKSEVIKRAGALGSLANLALNFVRNDSAVYDVPALKAAISSYGIDVSDLN